MRDDEGCIKMKMREPYSAQTRHYFRTYNTMDKNLPYIRPWLYNQIAHLYAVSGISNEFEQCRPAEDTAPVTHVSLLDVSKVKVSHS